jgi:hypothetical protein
MLSDTDVASVVVVVVVVSVAVDVGEELELACCVEQPPNIKAPTIKNATKNCETFNRIANY